MLRCVLVTCCKSRKIFILLRICIRPPSIPVAPEAAPAAALNLGRMLESQGDFQGAKAAYQIAIDSGHKTIAPTAAVNFVRLPAVGTAPNDG